MAPTQTQLKALGAATSMDASNALTLHIMEGALRRLARSPYAAELITRGGVMMRQWCAPAWRPTRDLDFLALHDTLQVDRLRAIWTEVCTAKMDDGVTFDAASAEDTIIWGETPWPGFRMTVPAHFDDLATTLQIDIGFGDPLTYPPIWFDYPALWPKIPTRIQTCRPEIGFGWKVHGLFERDDRRWQQKDLHDLYLMLHFADLDPELLPAAIATAFTSRNTPLEAMVRLIDGPFGLSRGSRRNWRRLHEARGGRDVPEAMHDALTHVVGVLRPIYTQLLSAAP